MPYKCSYIQQDERRQLQHGHGLRVALSGFKMVYKWAKNYRKKDDDDVKEIMAFLCNLLFWKRMFETVALIYRIKYEI